jgi:phage-related minor tail protein
MKLIREYDYFTEVGAIVRNVEKLKKQKIDVKFQSDGMRITEIGKPDLRTEIYQTADELRAYLNGLEDGAHGVKDYPELKNKKSWEGT